MISLPDNLRAEMIKIDAEIQKAFQPQFSGYNTRPVGSQWDYDAAIAQSRSDFKRAMIIQDDDGRGYTIEINLAYEMASAKLREYIAKKNERYKKDYMLVRDIDHGQDKLRSDRDRYKRALEKDRAEA